MMNNMILKTLWNDFEVLLILQSERNNILSRVPKNIYL